MYVFKSNYYLIMYFIYCLRNNSSSLKAQPYTFIQTSVINLDGDIFDSEMPTLLLRRHYKDASGFPHHALLSINSILEHDVLIEFKRKSFPGYPEATDTFPHGMGLNLIEFTVLCCIAAELTSFALISLNFVRNHWMSRLP